MPLKPNSDAIAAANAKKVDMANPFAHNLDPNTLYTSHRKTECLAPPAGPVVTPTSFHAPAAGDADAARRDGGDAINAGGAPARRPLTTSTVQERSTGDRTLPPGFSPNPTSRDDFDTVAGAAPSGLLSHYRVARFGGVGKPPIKQVLPIAPVEHAKSRNFALLHLQGDAMTGPTNTVAKKLNPGERQALVVATAACLKLADYGRELLDLEDGPAGRGQWRVGHVLAMCMGLAHMSETANKVCYREGMAFGYITKMRIANSFSASFQEVGAGLATTDPAAIRASAEYAAAFQAWQAPFVGQKVPGGVAATLAHVANGWILEPQWRLFSDGLSHGTMRESVAGARQTVHGWRGKWLRHQDDPWTQLCEMVELTSAALERAAAFQHYLGAIEGSAVLGHFKACFMDGYHASTFYVKKALGAVPLPVADTALVEKLCNMQRGTKPVVTRGGAVWGQPHLYWHPTSAALLATGNDEGRNAGIRGLALDFDDANRVICFR